jgi:hypothetical protein
VTGTQERIAGLEQQVADLAARVELLAHQALMIRTLDEIRLDHLGYGTGDRAGLKPSRPRHLMAVQGGRR